MTWTVVVTYRRRVSLGSGEARTRGLEMSILRSSSAFYVSSVQQKESNSFNNFYGGEPAFPRSGHETVEDRMASHKALDIIDIPDLTYFSDG
jgi:hypothetical protein